jgi:hypothetical protein
MTASEMRADECAQPFEDVVLQEGVQTISLVATNLTSSQASGLSHAVGEWNGCGGTVTNFTMGGPGELAIGVNYNDRRPTSEECSGQGPCACFDWNIDWDATRQKWVISGGTVQLFKTNKYGGSCESNSIAAMNGRITHELGHVLGLDDTSSGCAGRPMKQGETGGESVGAEDCTGAQEAQALANPSGGGDDDDPLNQDCTGGGCSPILIDLDRRGFKLSSWQDGVRFDLDADGDLEHIGWPTGSDAFLALDRNANGLIDDGSELFGNFTEQPSSDEPNGYIALAIFDDLWNGGDLDGWITPADSVFAELRLWFDVNRDGLTDPGELRGLSEAGIVRLSLSYLTSRSRDRHGNEFRYSAQVDLDQGVTRSIDVFLVTASYRRRAAGAP